jgi:hypothetical protein
VVIPILLVSLSGTPNHSCGVWTGHIDQLSKVEIMPGGFSYTKNIRGPLSGKKIYIHAHVFHLSVADDAVPMYFCSVDIRCAN